MSTKTLKKRIALVATVALGFGLMSVVPAFAANQTVATTVTAGTGTTTAGASAGRKAVAVSWTVTPVIAVGDDASTVTITTVVTGTHAGSANTDAQWNDAVNLTQTGTDNGSYTWAAVNATSGAKVATAGVGTPGADTNAGTPPVLFSFTPDVSGTFIFTTTITASDGTPSPASVTYTYTAYDQGTAGAIAIAKTSTVDAVALAASKYTSAPVLDPLQVSAISVEAGTTVILHLTSIGGTFTIADETKVAMRGYGVIVATALNAATADGIEDPLPSFVATSVPGTYTLDVTLGKNGTYAVATDLTTSITMVVTAGAALSSALSTRYHAAGAFAGDATTDLVPVFASKAAATNAGNITVTLKRTDGTAFTDTSQTIYASVTGAGLVDITADQTDVNGDTGTDLRIDSLANPADGIFNINVTSDGTGGTGTVAISVVSSAGVVTDLGSEVFTFYGDAATLTATQEIKIIRTVTSSGSVSGYTGTAPGAYDLAAILIKVKDSGGNAVPLASLSCVSSNLAVIAGCTLTEDAGTATYTRGAGSYFAQITTSAVATSGQSADVYVRMVDPADATKYLVTPSFTFKVASKTVASVALALDKTSYEPGEKATLTVTMKDSSGNAVADTWSTATTRSCVGSDVVANKSVTGSLPNATDGCWADAGVEVYKFYVPSIAGAFTLNTTSPADGVTPVVLTATVASSGTSSEATAQAAADAAAEATDAANAATDAANAAAEAADAATAAAQDAADAVAALSEQFSTLVASIKAQITSLTALIVKIQKKMKA